MIIIEENENLEKVTNQVKKCFGIKCRQIVLQAYDEEWEAWLDVEDIRSLRHQQKLCVATVDDEGNGKEIEKVSYFI